MINCLQIVPPAKIEIRSLFGMKSPDHVIKIGVACIFCQVL